MAKQSELSSAVVQAARRMALDRVARDVTAALEGAGVRAILLKGPSFARWLYDDDEWRPYGDVDLLVNPTHRDRAAAILTELDFADLDRWGKHGVRERPAHSSTWEGGDGTTVDLHWTIPGVAAPAATAWSVLSARTETIRFGSARVETLTRPARVMHVGLHALHHGPSCAQPLTDLERAIQRVSEDDWEEAAQLAEQLGATEYFAAGLRLLPVGAELADRLRLPVATSPEIIILRSPRGRSGALVMESVMAQRSFRSRASYAWRKLFPPIGDMRYAYPVARRGRLGLCLAHCRRWVRAVPVAASGIRVWRRARRASANARAERDRSPECRG